MNEITLPAEQGSNGHVHRFGIISVPPEYGHSYLRCVTCLLSKHLPEHDVATCKICCSRAAVAAPRGDELRLLLQRVSELTLDEGFGSYYQHGFEMFRHKMTAVLKARLAAISSPAASSLIAEQENRRKS